MASKTVLTLHSFGRTLVTVEGIALKSQAELISVIVPLEVLV